MSKKRKNIIGLTFKCEGKPGEPCGQRFVIGKLGVAAAMTRVKKHMTDKGHVNFSPVNPPKGLVYKSENGDVSVVYDGKDVDAYIKEVKYLVVMHRCAFIPQLKLSKV